MSEHRKIQGEAKETDEEQPSLEPRRDAEKKPGESGYYYDDTTGYKLYDPASDDDDDD